MLKIMKMLKYIVRKSASYSLVTMLLVSSLSLVSCETKLSEQKNSQHGEDTETPGQVMRPMEMNEEYYTDTNDYNPEDRQSNKRDPDQNTIIDNDQANDNTVTEE
jgi:hypothetical protein